MELNLDITRDTYTTIKCKQNDDLSLLINMYNNGSKYDLEGYLVILNVLRSNNTFIKQTSNIIISGNTLLIGCTRDVTRVVGLTKAELVIIKNNKQKTTFNIQINIIPSVITDNAQASKNVIGVIEDLDNKIIQGAAIVKEVDKNKTEAIDTVNKLKNDTITQLNNTKKDVETLKQQTITESTNIKDSAIKDLSKIKTDSITELNSIKDTSNKELIKIKTDVITDVDKAGNKAIEDINKYNIKELKDSVKSMSGNLNTAYRCGVYLENTNSIDLPNVSSGFINEWNIQGKTVLENGKLASFGEVEDNKIILQTKTSSKTIDTLEIQLKEPLRSIDGMCDRIRDNVVRRRCGVRLYQIGDETNTNVITDKINTIYKLNETNTGEVINKSLVLKVSEGCRLYCNNKVLPTEAVGMYGANFYSVVTSIADTVAELRDLIVKQDEEIQLLKQRIK